VRQLLLGSSEATNAEAMKFDLKKPCANCPFLKTDGAVRLRADRVREIHNTVTGSQGGSFPCHKTVSDEEREEEWLGPQPDWQWCAGALIYALKQESPNQLMRIALRLNIMDAEGLLGSPAANDVFGSQHEWLETAVDYEEDQAERDEIETCVVSEYNCDAPAGYMSGGGVIEGDVAADYRCYQCGEAVCGPCSSIVDGHRLCLNCHDEEEIEDDTEVEEAG
jgi:hypothetical protein